MTLLLRTRLSGKHIYDPNNIPRSEDKKKRVNGARAYIFNYISLQNHLTRLIIDR